MSSPQHPDEYSQWINEKWAGVYDDEPAYDSIIEPDTIDHEDR